MSYFVHSQNSKELPLASSVCPSTWNNSVTTGQIFMKFCIMYVSIFQKFVKKNSSLMFYKNDGYLT